VLLLVPELFAPVRAVATLFHASADGLAATERILDALDRTPVDANPTVGSREHASSPPVTLPVRGAQVGLRAVTVRYPGRPLPALDRVDLDLQPGELVAVVGASGAGKTTLGRVLLGLTRPDEGFVVAGGRPLTDADLDEKVATSAIYLAVGLAIGSLLSGVARSAVRRRG
jgi:ABC-type transport system involved in cytochrome bd biosynthesis fused ATPase/permease subunit